MPVTLDKERETITDCPYSVLFFVFVFVFFFFFFFPYRSSLIFFSSSRSFPSFPLGWKFSSPQEPRPLPAANPPQFSVQSTAR